MTAEIQQLQNAIAEAETTQQAYRDDVRHEILRQHFDGPWCLPGTQEVLADLNLLPVTMGYQGQAVLRVSITDVADATSMADARARVILALEVVNSDPSITIHLDHVEPSLDEKERDDR
jgi:type II secretory pathway pseudopilin PulG